MTAVELAAGDLDGLRVGLDLDVDRVELCAGLELGGLTPSAGLVARAVAIVADARARGSRTRLHVLVRPRPGGFEHDPDEVAVLVDDVRRLVDLGVDGVVVGALRSGSVDEDALTRLLAAGAGAEITLHRAIDFADDPVAALAVLDAAGVDRVLTSGGGADVRAGRDVLAAMCALPRSIAVTAGGGVTVEVCADLVALGVDGVHFSAGRQLPGRPGARPGARLGSATADGSGGRQVTDPALAARLVDAVRRADRVAG
jgi:copper homeostasis protein